VATTTPLGEGVSCEPLVKLVVDGSPPPWPMGVAVRLPSWARGDRLERLLQHWGWPTSHPKWHWGWLAGYRLPCNHAIFPFFFFFFFFLIFFYKKRFIFKFLILIYLHFFIKMTRVFILLVLMWHRNRIHQVFSRNLTGMTKLLRKNIKKLIQLTADFK
jgi:hypothetical protein